MLLRITTAAAVLCGCSSSSTRPDPIPAIPAARGNFGITYDEDSHRVLLFGGAGAALMGDLWAWDGRIWTRLSETGPSPRDDAVLVYDAARHRAVLYGGRTSTGANPTVVTDTWEWDGTRWTRLDDTGPGARLHPVAAYDRARGRVVLYGGGAVQEDRSLTDTWEWNGQHWTRIDNAGPGTRALDGMVYDPSRQTLQMLTTNLAAPVAGASGLYQSEVWEWTGTSWNRHTVAAPPLSPIQHLAPAGAAGGMLLFDGYNGGGSEGATWLWNNTSWSLATGGGPSARNGHGMAFDAARQRVVLFGGSRGPQDMSDTWEWDGTRWQRIEPATP